MRQDPLLSPGPLKAAAVSCPLHGPLYVQPVAQPMRGWARRSRVDAYGPPGVWAATGLGEGRQYRAARSAVVKTMSPVLAAAWLGLTIIGIAGLFLARESRVSPDRPTPEGGS
jgi:hypothetical protein